MGRTHNARVFLAGALLLPGGSWAHGLGSRFSNPGYRNNEDLYTLLWLVGLLPLLVGVILIVAAVRGLQKIARIIGDRVSVQPRLAQTSGAP